MADSNTLFRRIPDRFFSILSSAKKELYVEALFVIRQAFKTELVIRQEDLAAMLMDALEGQMQEADFSDELTEEDVTEQATNLSGKAHLLLRRLKTTGWIETEYETRSFDENITIPDYAISVINLLYDLSEEKVKEYNSYVYATYTALINAENNPDYVYQALFAAWQNTIRLIDELKSLFNNIRRYYSRIPYENDVNNLLRDHFDEYKAKIFDNVYYPLKTIDSVPRFKHGILAVLNSWLADEEIQRRIVEQGISRRVFKDEESGREEMFSMINFVADSFDGIEEMIEEIDRKHNEYTNASIEHIRYLMNVDRGMKGKLIELLKASNKHEVLEMMQDNITAYRHSYYDQQRSLYSKAARTVREEGTPLALESQPQPEGVVEDFLNGVRRQYTNKKIDGWIEGRFRGADFFTTEDADIAGTEDFILFLLGTLRGREKSAAYTVEFSDGYATKNGYRLPKTVFKKKA